MYTIYSDGSSSWKTKEGGWAFILFEDEKFITSVSDYEEETTNNREELRSVIEGLLRTPKESFIYVYSDSKYVVNAFNNDWVICWIKNEWLSYRSGEPIKNQDLWMKIYKLTEERVVTYKWVKAHSTNKFNNLCDERARFSRINKIRKTYNNVQ